MLMTGALTVIFGSFAIGDSVSAHTGFESSAPADGAITLDPVSEVVISFTGAASPAGDGFVALDPTGQTRMPSAVSVSEDRIFTLTFDPPLAGGMVGLRWSLQAPDAHPIEGSFSFVTPSPTPIAPPVAEDEGLAVAESVSPAIPEPVVAAAVDLDEFLATDGTRPGESTARLGRILGLGSLVVVIGLIAFLATTLVGRLAEVRAGFMAVRVLGAVLALGAAIEYVGVTRIAGAGLGDMWATSAGFSTMLRLIGGGILAMGFVPTIKREQTAPLSLSAAVLERPRRTMAHVESSSVDNPHLSAEPRHEVSERVRWVPGQDAWTVGLAVSAMLVSFWFDGHTVSKGPRVLHALFNTVHVAAGSIWVGGVVAMAAILWRRRRSGQPGRPHELVVRFSGVATLALGAVALAGLLMSVLVLDSVGELTGTVWGKVLLLKTAAVALAACAGAYNHFKLLPALDAAPHDPELEAEVRSSVTAEAIMLIFVVIVTASLVVAAS